MNIVTISVDKKLFIFSAFLYAIVISFSLGLVFLIKKWLAIGFFNWLVTCCVLYIYVNSKYVQDVSMERTDETVYVHNPIIENKV